MTIFTTRRRFDLDVAADATSSIFYTPEGVSPLTVSVNLTGSPLGTATVQYTISSFANSPSTVNWVDWDAGSVSVDTTQVAQSPLTGIRLVTVGGTASLEVVW